MTPLTTLARVETALLLREPAAVLLTLLLPLLLLTLNGAGGNEPNPQFGGAATVDVLLAGYLVYVVATSAMMGLSGTLADYRDRGILRRLRVSPLRPWQILGSHAVAHLTISMAGAVLLVGAGLVAFDLNPPAAWVPALLALLATAASLIAVGFLLGAVLPSARTTQAVAAAIYFPAIFVSGAVWPREALPEFAQRVGDLLPLTYAVGAIREAWTGGAVDVAALGVLVATAAIATVAAVRAFRWEAR